MTVWSLVTCVPEVGRAAPIVGAADDRGEVYSVPLLSDYPDVGAVMRQWDELAPLLRDWEPSDGERLGAVGLVAPLPSPRKLICAGANYRDHLREMGIAEVPADFEPYFFLLPATSIAGPGQAVLIPDDPARGWTGRPNSRSSSAYPAATSTRTTPSATSPGTRS